MPEDYLVGAKSEGWGERPPHTHSGPVPVASGSPGERRSSLCKGQSPLKNL